jgi:hypothetical protein
VCVCARAREREREKKECVREREGGVRGGQVSLKKREVTGLYVGGDVSR